MDTIVCWQCGKKKESNCYFKMRDGYIHQYFPKCRDCFDFLNVTESFMEDMADGDDKNQAKINIKVLKEIKKEEQIKKDYEVKLLKRKTKNHARDIQRKNKYNMTDECFNKMLEDQNYSCALCFRHESEFKSEFFIDHNHDCCSASSGCGNCVRGLLCVACNSGLGLLQDDPAIFMRAIEYVALGAPQKEKIKPIEDEYMSALLLEPKENMVNVNFEMPKPKNKNIARCCICLDISDDLVKYAGLNYHKECLAKRKTKTKLTVNS